MTWVHCSSISHGNLRTSLGSVLIGDPRKGSGHRDSSIAYDESLEDGLIGTHHEELRSW